MAAQRAASRAAAEARKVEAERSEAEHRLASARAVLDSLETPAGVAGGAPAPKP